MLKHVFFLLVASVVAVLFKSHLIHVLNVMLHMHNQVAAWLAMIFSGDNIGRMIQGVFALLTIPVLVGGVVGAGYWMIKRQQLPHLYESVWVMWIVLLVSMVAQAG